MEITLSDCLHGSIVRIGQHTYRVYRLEELRDGILGTMTRFARIQPCLIRGKHWWDDHNQKFEIRNWSDRCFMIDDTRTAVAGEKYDTRD